MTDSPARRRVTDTNEREEKEIKSTIVMESGRFVRDNLGAEVQRRVADVNARNSGRESAG